MNSSEQLLLDLPIEMPTVWQKLRWRTSPLGRVRLTLANSYTNKEVKQVYSELQAGWALLQAAQFSNYAEADKLRSLLLARLTELAIQLPDLPYATIYLTQLEKTTISAHIQLILRWHLIQALVASEQEEDVIHQITQYVAHEKSQPDKVADCLTWLLTNSNTAVVQLVGQAIALQHCADEQVATLRLLCLTECVPDDKESAQVLLNQTRPSLLTDRPILQGQTHLLRAKCAEVVGNWLLMAAEAEEAIIQLPHQDEARYWYARALLHQNNAEATAQAVAELSRPPHAMSHLWQRLSIIAAVWAHPEIEEAASCLSVIEGQYGQLDEMELKLAVSGMEFALQSAVDDPAERLEVVARLSDRLMAQVGSLAWAEYNVVVKEICANNLFEQVEARLASITESPSHSCPLYLLRAVCATMLERWDDLPRLLAMADSPPPDFAADVRFFRTLVDTLTYWQGEPQPAKAATLFDQLQQPTGRLIQAIPTLKIMHALIYDFFAAVTGRGAARAKLPDEPPQTAWVQWLWRRLWLQHGHRLAIEDCLANYDPYLALTWEHIGWLQEFSAVISPTAQPTLQIALADLKRVSQPLTARWQQLVTLRQHLLEINIENLPATITEPGGQWGDCPWWPANGLWQELSQYEAQIEDYYLNGRLALRRQSPSKALTWFNAANTLLDQPRATGTLTAVRFAPILQYWEGVALAHLHRYDEAIACLQDCLTGPKQVEAMVQIGLIAVSQDDLESASRWLDKIPTPHPPAAVYLAALLAKRFEDDEQAAITLNNLLNADRTYSTIYTVAAYRLRGVLEERSGNRTAAIATYRQALSYWPADAVAAARLARLWLQNSYSQRNQPQSIVFESILEDKWDRLGQISWAANSPLMYRCLRALATGDPLPASMAENVPVTANGAGKIWGQFLMRIFLATGDIKRAKNLADGLRFQSPLFSVIATILSGRELLVAYCQGNGDEKLRSDIEHFALALEELQTAVPTNQSVIFWHDLAEIVLEPAQLAAKESLANLVESAELPSSYQFTVALLSLFSNSKQLRQQAANLCVHLADTELLKEEQKAQAQCLAAYTSGDDNSFLKYYERLEQKWPSSLLCEEAALYVATCQARLKSHAFRAITHGFIPPSLADLSQPQVRQMVGLAFAQGAATYAQSDVRKALRDLEQAIDLLGLLTTG